jgi:hypothetical protein
MQKQHGTLSCRKPAQARRRLRPIAALGREGAEAARIAQRRLLQAINNRSVAGVAYSGRNAVRRSPLSSVTMAAAG